MDESTIRHGHDETPELLRLVNRRLLAYALSGQGGNGIPSVGALALSGRERVALRCCLPFKSFTELRAFLQGQREARMSRLLEPPRSEPIVARVPKPPSGWSFSPGVARYNGVEIKLNGIPFKLLEALANAGGALTRDELIEAGWGHDADTEPDTLRKHLSSLRGLLRSNLAFSGDPVPCVDKRDNSAWKLDVPPAQA